MTAGVSYPHWVMRGRYGDATFYFPVDGYPDLLTNRPAQAKRFANRPSAKSWTVTVRVEFVPCRIALTPVLRLQADLSPGASL